MNVYITEKGEKYHIYKSCIKKYNTIKTTEEEAKKLGKQLCKNCDIRFHEIKQNKKYYKNNNYNNNYNKKQNFINKHDPDDIIYNNTLMRNQESTEEDILSEINNNSKNSKSVNIINNTLSIDFNKLNLNQNMTNLDNDKNNNINILSDSNESEEEEEEEKINTNKKNNKNNLDINHKINNNNFNDINEIKMSNKIAEKIQANIEDDKYHRKKNLIQKKEIKIEKENENNIMEKVPYSFIEDSKEDESIYSQGFQSYKTVSKHKINLCGTGDMDILRETDEENFHLSFQKQINVYNNKDLYQNLQLGKYKYTFEISNLKGNMIVEIEVGFKIVYKNSLDINFSDKKLIKCQNKKFKIGTLYDTLIVAKQLIIGEDTNKVYAFMNVKKGKFFIIGKEELEKRRKNVYLTRDNTEIFYVKNCGPIFYCEMANVEPIFNFDENTLKKCDIKFNGKKIVPKI